MLALKKSIFLDMLGQPFRKAIVTAARLGADAVEINGRTEVQAQQLSRTGVRQIRKLLTDVNLQVSAIHFQTNYGYGDLKHLDQRIDATKATLQLAYELGCQVVVNRIGKINPDTDSAERSTMEQALTDIGLQSHKAGAWLAARTGTDDGATLKSLIDTLPPQTLKIDFDPAELIVNGHSPSESMRSLATHIVNCRARDAVTDFSVGRGVETQLGDGAVDWPDLLGQLEEKSYSGFLTVDYENSPAPILSAQSAFTFLQGLFG